MGSAAAWYLLCANALRQLNVKELLVAVARVQVTFCMVAEVAEPFDAT
jgi:hypothetical protein